MTSIYDQLYRELLRRLKEARLQSGLTQVQAARRLRKYVTYISKCESGERRLDVLELEKLADIYGKKIGWFIPKK